MSELLQASLAFPTVIFTIALGIALVYWLFVLLGALDIDLLGGHDVGDLHTDVHGDFDFGFGAVPVTITISLILLLGWTGTLLGMHYLPDMWWLVLPLVVILAVPITALLIRPIAPVFAVKEGKSNSDYVGHTCTVTTGSVDTSFGQATIEDGGTVLVIAIRCDRPGKLARGDRALIIDFDQARQAYVVEPVAEL